MAANRNIFCQDVAIGADTDTPSGVVIHDWMSTRQKLELRTETPGTACAGCHAQINPKGYVFEIYDALGRFRTQENVYENGSTNILQTHAVDASSTITLWGGKTHQVTNIVDLSSALAASPQPHACFTQAVWRFAHGLNKDSARDGCALQSLYRNLVKEDGSILEMMKTIALQESFKKRKAD
jgi:hypothetical protein